jgi:MYXO-CTERM domain-containing protein
LLLASALVVGCTATDGARLHAGIVAIRGGEPEPPIDCTAVACAYVREGAGGSGVDWTDAYAELPATLQRGAVYFVADGSYPGYTFDDPSEGGVPITVRKALVSDHGTDVGWSDEDGDGQAIFDGLSFANDDFIIDGATRNEDDWADAEAYGFRVGSLTASTAAFSGVCASHLVFRHVDAGGPEGDVYTGSEPGEAIYVGGFDELCTDWRIERTYLHNIASYTLIQFAGIDGATVEYSRFQNAWGKEAIRGQNAARNLVIRYNQFYDACGTTGLPGEGCTAEIALWDGSDGAFDNNQIYGNWFFRDNGDQNSGGTIVVGGDGISWVGAPANNTMVFNNTIAGVKNGSVSGIILLNGAGNVCRNNLWFDTDSNGCTAETTSDNVVARGDPFVDYAAADLHLADATVAGTTLRPPFDRDMDGRMRGGDGHWDVGALELGVGGSSGETGSDSSGSVDGTVDSSDGSDVGSDGVSDSSDAGLDTGSEGNGTGGNSGSQREDSGCGCTADGERSPALWLAAVVLFAASRRRRARVHTPTQEITSSAVSEQSPHVSQIASPPHAHVTMSQPDGLGSQAMFVGPFGPGT